MRFKLTQKILFLNVGIIVALTVAFISLSYVASKSMYSNALNGIDLAVMEDLAPTLADIYAQEGSWEPLQKDAKLWSETVDHSFFKVFFSLMAKTAAIAPNKDTRAMQIPGPPPKSTPAWEMPFGTFLQRATLYDADKNPLITPPIVKKDINFQAIRHNGTLIGWLSIGKIDADMLPLAEYFFQQQLHIVNWAMAVGGLLAALLSLLFSRHLIRPIQQLIKGAQQIGQRDFSTQIKVNSGDEMQELAERFNELAAELARHQQQQKQWLTNISHELKTPLTLLMGEIYAVCDNLTQCDENTASFLQHEVSHVKRLVDDLFEMSKGDELGLKLVKHTIEFLPFLDHLLSPYRPLFAQKNLKIVEIYEGEEFFIYADSDRLTQVCRNILENCLRYMDTPGTFRIVLSRSFENLLLRFEDSGPGVSAQVAAQMFDRLYRADSSTARASGGAGVGLAICKMIVQAHGGKISAATSDLGGIAVRIELPMTNDTSA